ncbi:hypothetical protein SLA2020_319220 [Shorea laevis]
MMHQAGRYMAVYRKLAEKYPSFGERSETTDLIVKISLQPWEAFSPDGVIIFLDIRTPLPAFGVPFDIEQVRGPVIQKPIISEECLKALHPIDLVKLHFVGESLKILSGTITANMLSKLVNLWDLDLSNNSLLSLSNNGTVFNYSFPNLRYLVFSSCNIHKFPSFLRKAKRLQVLDISKNKISDQIHKCEIEVMSFSRLNLSYNFLQLAFFLPPRRSDKNIVCMNLISWQKLQAVALSF